MNDNEKFYMQKILSHDWEIDGKTQKLWQWIRDKKITSAPSFQGKLYSESQTKIMYVGHAVNGWEASEIAGRDTLEETLDAIMSQENGLDTFVRKDFYSYLDKKGNQRFYNHINSKFLRLIKHILEFQGESTIEETPSSPISENAWYNDEKEWNQKIVWANLYPIAPWKGGNPEPKQLKECMDDFTALFKSNILTYQPDVVICCPLSGFFNPWARKMSFFDVLDDYNMIEDNDSIIAEGKLANSLVLVCKRPDGLGKAIKNPYEVRDMAKKISDYIDSKLKQ